MTPATLDVELVDDEALLRHLDRVEANAAIGHGDAACLVERTGGTEPLGVLVDQPVGAVPAAGFLVGGGAEDDVAAQAGDRVRGGIAAGRAGGAGEAAHDLHLHRDHALHVDGAAAPDVSVGQIRGERVVAPAGRLRGHDVQVG